ncbi:hypothetical protein [Nocardioides sp. LHG3406-4]|uniref:hypothetical protein n=1 Tax=Nocardioides sp. LHG3406-4 TaxID=2804575 RepID=UPI003CEC1C73
MSGTTRDRWLEDRRGVLDRHRDQVWWTCLRWVTSSGLACALVLRGWRIPLVVGLTVVIVATLLVLPRGARVLGLGRVLDDAVLAGLATVGGIGLLAALGVWGVLLLVLLAVEAPPVRRFRRDAGAVLRWSRAVTHDARSTWPPSWPDGYDGYGRP